MSDPRRKLWRRDLLKGAAFGGVLAGIQLYQGIDAVRGPTPELDVVHLSSIASPGGAHLVHFWATWCGVCHAMEHNIRAFDPGVAMMVASASGSPAQVATWLQSEGKSTSGVVVDRGGNAEAWGVRAYPTTFVVSTSDEIVDACVGYTTELGLRARLMMAG